MPLPRGFADRRGSGLRALEERRHFRQIPGGPRQTIEAAQRLFEPAGIDLGGRRAGLLRHPLRLAAPFDLAPEIARRPVDVGMRRGELLELLQRQLVLAGCHPAACRFEGLGGPAFVLGAPRLHLAVAGRALPVQAGERGESRARRWGTAGGAAA